MLTIQISDSRTEFENISDIDESWINQQINRRRRDGLTICVRISIKNDAPDVNMGLATAACTSSGGGSRPPNSYESRIFNLWEQMGLSKSDFQSGSVVAFLKQLRKIIG
jgi:hypothetical protein